MFDEDSLRGSDSELSSSPSNRSVDLGSDLFKAVLSDYFLECKTRISKAEYDRYQAKKDQKKDDEDHVVSKSCVTCQNVLALCKCDVDHYDGVEQKLGQKVHWADEVWKRPLITIFDDDSPSERLSDVQKTVRNPKPILKHKATCIIIVSE